MEAYISENKKVAKYIHMDGSETAIKMTNGCDGKRNNNKYVVFISSSVGCEMKCKFCYLTTKKCPYDRLDCNKIKANTLEAINAFININPSARKKYIKLSFMGMGDVFTSSSTILISKDIIGEAIKLNYAKGFDGVDVGTMMPKKFDRSYVGINMLKVYDHNIRYYCEEHNIKRNPKSKNRSIIRLFYSFHTPDKKLRKELIPGSGNMIDDIIFFNAVSDQIDVIFHVSLMATINDDYEDIYDLINFYKKHKLEYVEFRFLKFNECKFGNIKSPDYEHTLRMYDILKRNIKKVKFQYSAGDEIKAACGQFIARRL